MVRSKMSHRSCATPIRASKGSSSRTLRLKIGCEVSRERKESVRSRPRVKVCGVTTPEDARMVACAGADFVGMICWTGSKRHVGDGAKEVARAARENGSIPVLVFVDGSAEEITEKCEEAGVEYAQLHGDQARMALPKIPMRIKVIYALSADSEGNILTPLPSQVVDEYNRANMSTKKTVNPVTTAFDWVSGGRRAVEWLLIDGVKAGSGEKFGWENLKVPRGCSRKGWLLAGGLGPDNVSEAIELLHPDGVDVATGVSDMAGVRKEEQKVTDFFRAIEQVTFTTSNK